MQSQVAHEDDAFGGFPDLQQLFSRVLEKMSPRLKKKLKRSLTVPRAETLIPSTGGAALDPQGPVKPVSYLSFSAIVKRNSSFCGLTAENFVELGGVEYRALSALLWIIPVVRRKELYLSANQLLTYPIHPSVLLRSLGSLLHSDRTIYVPSTLVYELLASYAAQGDQPCLVRPRSRPYNCHW